MKTVSLDQQKGYSEQKIRAGALGDGDIIDCDDHQLVVCGQVRVQVIKTIHIFVWDIVLGGFSRLYFDYDDEVLKIGEVKEFQVKVIR